MTETRQRSPARTHTVRPTVNSCSTTPTYSMTRPTRLIHSICIVGDLVWAAIITVSTVYEQHVSVSYVCDHTSAKRQNTYTVTSAAFSTAVSPTVDHSKSAGILLLDRSLTIVSSGSYTTVCMYKKYWGTRLCSTHNILYKWIRVCNLLFEQQNCNRSIAIWLWAVCTFTAE